MKTAHLVVRLQSREGDPFPLCVGVQITSSGPMGLTTCAGDMYAEIMKVSADTFANAQSLMMEIIDINPSFHWMKPWLDTGLEAYMNRQHLYELNEERQQAFHDGRFGIQSDSRPRGAETEYLLYL